MEFDSPRTDYVPNSTPTPQVTFGYLRVEQLTEQSIRTNNTRRACMLERDLTSYNGVHLAAPCHSPAIPTKFSHAAPPVLAINSHHGLEGISRFPILPFA